MVGSTESAQADEANALRLRAEQAALIRPLFIAHHGREVKSMGDGFLAEFDSALTAVQCAVDIQQHLHERNARAGATAIAVRIGVHLGDVEQLENDIFGDAVNIASRIEPLASPGGVCISGEVASQVRNKIPNALEKLAPTKLKGVHTPVEIYRVELPWTTRRASSESGDRRGIAVLPFANISPDPKDEYFADGLTEELITVLSKVSGLRVIARTSVQPYRSTSKGVSQIGAELRVSSILEGSVRKAGTKLRITAQLIDVDSEGHLWAETYDRDLDDVFAVQADVAKRVSEALSVSVSRQAEPRSATRRKVNPNSYLAYLRGRTLLHNPISRGLEVVDVDRSIEQFKLAISLDGDNAAAHAGLSEAIHERGLLFGDIPHPVWSRLARDAAARAVELDSGGAEGHGALAIALYDDNQYDAAEREFTLALSLNPNDAYVHFYYGDLLMEEARPVDAERELALAEELDPLSSAILVKSVHLLLLTRKLDAARSKIEAIRGLALSEYFYHVLLNHCAWAESDNDGQIEQLELSLRAEPVSQWNDLLRAWTFAGAGRKASASALLPAVETISESVDKFRYLAETYARMDDLDGFFRTVNRATEIHKFEPTAYRLDPKYENVRRDPRFQTLLGRMNLV